jgi:hypothetical protein
MTSRPGSRRFLVLTMTTAATWTAGAFVSGPLHLGWIEGRDSQLRRPVVTPVATGIGAFGFFYACALAARKIPPLDDAISRVLVFAEKGEDRLVLLTTLANGLGEAGVPVTVVRAGIIVGHGGLSWELTRQLVEHLPAMVTPRWVRTRTQPIAVDDVVRYLVGVLGLPAASGRVFEVGGPEVLQYVTMLKRVAAIENRPLVVVPVPLLTPSLSSLWLSLVTDVDNRSGRNLVDSMTNEVIVEDDSILELVPFERTSYDDAVRAALDERRRERSG